jgi:hypothetical protein
MVLTPSGDRVVVTVIVRPSGPVTVDVVVVWATATPGMSRAASTYADRTITASRETMRFQISECRFQMEVWSQSAINLQSEISNLQFKVYSASMKG